MQRLLIILFFLLYNHLSIYATHNRAGEITYKCISALTYEFTVTTYTKESSSQADRCALEIRFSDGKMDTIYRDNGPTGSNCTHIGVSLGPTETVDIKFNTYKTTHTFPGPGIYSITVEDPNRNAEVLNIPIPDQTTFFIVDTLVINPLTGCNNSPLLQNPPIQKACVNEPYVHNPGANDALDGDSISYSLITCLGVNGQPIQGYQFPNGISINNSTGTITWDSPQYIGEYNIAILLREWRFDTYSRTYIYIGSMIRDMQITVEACINKAPVITVSNPVCVEAGKKLSFPVTATDINHDQISLTATGEPLSIINSPATFTQPAKSDSVTGYFNWDTQCSHIRKMPYQATFQANDNDLPVSLVDIETVDISIVGPAPRNPFAIPEGNTIKLSWEQSICSEAVGYRVYRRVDSVGFSPDTCEIGVPSYTGYTHIATINKLLDTTFVDDNIGVGLNHGQRYCYMVVAFFPDGAESYASIEFCSELIQDASIITHVSVGITDSLIGKDTIRWSPPRVIDTNQYTGPYHYKIYRSSFITNSRSYIGSTAINSIFALTDTTYIDSLINTKNTPHFYHIVLFSGNDSVCSSQVASSIFLMSSPSTNQLALRWNENVPWNNTLYIIFKYNSDSSRFIPLDTVNTQQYVDSGLTNGDTYCYYVKSIGTYSLEGIINPIINFSQIHCNIPRDTVPPCPPSLSIYNDCDNFQNTLAWVSSDSPCDDDVVQYKLYYAPMLGEKFQWLMTINNPNDTTFLHDNLTSVAGCYVITAIDSFNNSSKWSNSVCVDNCPIYELPNVFTPNNDGKNDYLTPFPYRYVESIELQIFNRWEQLVFYTTDPNIFWDGINQDTKKHCSSGVYYYICKVNEIRLTGIVPRAIKGYIHLYRENIIQPSD